ncbi:hypothetical protein JCM1840_003284 [Sporobolomyces johnsonii]
MFNLHSLHPGCPYDPSSPQYFSRTFQGWYDIADLQTGGHFYPVDKETGAEESTKLEEAAVMGTKKNSKGKEKEKGKSRASGSSCSSTTTPLVRHITDLLQPDFLDNLIAALQKLSQSLIVHGGANKLTGNTYLITRTSELVAILAPSASPTSVSSSSLSSTKAATDAAAKSHTLLTSAAKWEQEVEDRENGVGRRGARVWARHGGRRGGRPAGASSQWVFPESGGFI